jgi:hypothetical protein
LLYHFVTCSFPISREKDNVVQHLRNFPETTTNRWSFRPKTLKSSNLNPRTKIEIATSVHTARLNRWSGSPRRKENTMRRGNQTTNKDDGTWSRHGSGTSRKSGESQGRRGPAKRGK